MTSFVVYKDRGKAVADCAVPDDEEEDWLLSSHPLLCCDKWRNGDEHADRDRPLAAISIRF